jgi:hypothetical protein
MSGRALAFDDLLVHLGAMDLHPGRGLDTEFHLGTVEFENVQGDVIADGNDFAYGTA